MTAMAAPVLAPSGAIGVVTIAGPLVRLTEARMEELAEALLATADEIRAASGGVGYVQEEGLGVGGLAAWSRGKQGLGFF
ncbi:hypothetical protein [Polaromonas sp. YR568]|uniref:hypothetical protein n=1 Tax=Polaromonas sp. YR568 TaxID=1855301 RepID=UPI00398C193F